ncbi:hypothetical protein C9374_013383 [Naegleria lovaniensis]|uniref:Uncharacterized protein n=1 Tax=Naegleria lovaniensis TaxID=51637 RepID=A0AA88KNB1_NAELO|nr:uncharacterized protein C9374_013383 [Naegleria lovaniensis]KAG2391898.1 hypothetical protein C9374_013383 [Naegleria lovaniensis]
MFEKEEPQSYPLKKRRSSLLGMIPSMLLGHVASSSDLLSSSPHVSSSSSTPLNGTITTNVNVCICGTSNTGKKSLVSYMVNGYHNPSSSMQRSAFDDSTSDNSNDEESVESWCDSAMGSFVWNNSSTLHHHSRTTSKGDLIDVDPDYVKQVDMSSSEKLKLNFFIFSHSDTEVRSRNVLESDVTFKNIVKIAHIIIYVYDVTNMTSFEAVKYYYEQILNIMSSNECCENMESYRFSCSPQSPSLLGPLLQRHNIIMKPSMVIGAKIDLEEDRVVTESNIMSHQRIMNGVTFHECSCLTGENVLSCFEDLKLLSKPNTFLSKPTSDNGRNSRRSSITLSSRQSMSCNSSPNLDNTANKRASRIFDSVKKVGDMFRVRSNSMASNNTERKIPSSPASSSAPTINDKRRSQSIGVIISQHEKNTGFVIKPEITTLELQVSVPSQVETCKEPKQEVRKRPTSYSWKNIFKKK